MKKFLIVLMTFLIMYGCNPYEHPLKKSDVKTELLVYCGITMVAPVLELKKIFEKNENIIIKIIYGGSGSIMRIAMVNKKGDLFLPGSKSYIVEMSEKGLIEEYATVGYNIPAMFVAKNNPKKIKSDIMEFLRPDVRISIGNSKSGSIGKETKRIMEHFGIYKEVVSRAIFQTTDSKKLAWSIRNNVADLCINWKAVGIQERNKGHMEVLELDSEYVSKNPLVMSVLKYSEDKKAAKKFLYFVSSAKGLEVFKRHGF